MEIVRTILRRLWRPAIDPHGEIQACGQRISLRCLVEALPVVVYVDAPGDELGSLWISSNVEGLLGYPLELWQRDRGLFSSLLHPDDLVRLRREQRGAAVGAEHTTEYRLIAADGRTVWIRDRYTISTDADGRPLMVQGVMEDVTALRAAENRFREVLDDINLLAVTLDRGGRVVFANDHFLATMGRRRDEVVGQDWFGLFAPMEERDLRRQSYAHAMETGMIPRHGELRLLTADGGVRLIRYNHTLVMGDDGKPAQLTSIAEDITDRRRAEDEVHRLAHYDPLTRLPNRTTFSKDLDEAIRCSARLGRTVGVMFVSLDDFTLVNDSLGPAAGDALLRQFTARLEEAASIAATVARQGGDEFLVLLADCDPSPDSETHLVAEDVAQMAGAIDNRLQRLLRKPFCHDGTDIYLSATVGVALCPRDAAESDSLLKAALLDRYSTRGVGRPARKPPRGMAPADELAMTTRLHQAIDERTFHLDYQPVFELATRRMIGVEALLRWRDPFGNPIPPDAFIPLAERTGLIAPITDWVIEQVCRQRLAWRTAGIELDIGFNFPTTLWDGRTVAQVLSTIRGFGLRPADLVMEVTESTAMQDETATATVTDMLRSSGMRLAIDDFGTGYSSLSRLRHLHASTIKVDRTFVRDIPHDPESAAVVTTIVRLAENLGVTTLAEGIETEAQRRFLLELGCINGQGFLFSRPLPAEAVERLWRGGARRAA